jgi:hypothetical protein
LKPKINRLRKSTLIWPLVSKLNLKAKGVEMTLSALLATIHLAAYTLVPFY